MYNNPTYQLSLFSELNEQRANRIFQIGDKGNLYWATALAEEVGEIAGAIKKLERGFNRREFKKVQDIMIVKEKQPINVISLLHYDNPTDNAVMKATWVKIKRRSIGKEIADVLIYLDLLATKNDIDMWEELRLKFNQVSDEMECPYLKINPTI